MNTLIDEKEILIFDAYGTLFKTKSFESELVKLVGSKGNALILLWRRKQLEYTWLYSQMGQFITFDKITVLALKYSMEVHGVKDHKVYDLLISIFKQPSLVAGVEESLRHFVDLGKRMVILSNGTAEMLSNAVRQTGIDDWMESLISVDEIRKYKPAPEVYGLAMKKLQCKAKDCLFFSSNQWDVSGAFHFGLDAIWINHSKEVREPLDYYNVREVGNMADLIR